VLQGRDTGNLGLMVRYASRELVPLGWRIECGTDLHALLAGARIVVHQMRYGGLEGRAADESTALRFGIQPDETLGPAALESLLRMRDSLRATARAIAAACPEAWVLNLTNPLSVVTAVLAEAGVERCIGLCELPFVTMMQAAAILDRPPASMVWRYAGFNHRGFIVTLEAEGTDRLGELVTRLGGGALGGIRGEEIARLRSIPTKYFRLLDPSGIPKGGRAWELAAVRGRIAEQLRSGTEGSPPGLRERYMEWYPRSVVPMIAALRSSEPSEQIVNLRGSDGLVREIHARVSREGIEPRPIPVLEGEVARWTERFAHHENLLLEVARSAGREAIRRALDADPMIPSGIAPAIAEDLWARYGSVEESVVDGEDRRAGRGDGEPFERNLT